mgnify:CR=1 FL=1
MTITLETLKKTHGEAAPAVFKQIALMGGFGDVPDTYGLDIGGLPDAKLRGEIEALINSAGKGKEGK